jgi:hypothetical protein
MFACYDIGFYLFYGLASGPDNNLFGYLLYLVGMAVLGAGSSQVAEKTNGSKEVG